MIEHPTQREIYESSVKEKGRVGILEVAAMVYRGRAFPRFIAKQLLDLKNDPGRRVGIITSVTQNDPDNACMDEIFTSGLADVHIYHDPDPQDHYLSRVYRCWNYIVGTSPAEYVCLVNSDMAFSPGWLEALERRLDGRTLPCSRLVEPGFLRPGEHAIEIDLGRDPKIFPISAWHQLAADLLRDSTAPGGLFMPCVLHRETFLRVGGYPEGNVNGVSGDRILFDKMADAGFAHVTCFDSLVYHMQEGEMRYRGD